MIGLFPPPFSSGERILNQMLYNIYKDAVEVEKINLSLAYLRPNNSIPRKLWYYLLFTLKFLLLLPKFWRLRDAQITHVFFIASNGFVGHLRDVVMQYILFRPGQVWFTIVQNGNFENVFKRSYMKNMTVHFFERVSYVVLTSEGLKKRVDGYLPSDKLKVVYNSISTELFVNSVEKPLRKATDSLKVLYLSNMNPTKGYFELIKAIAELPEEYKRRILATFVGEWLSQKQLDEFLAFIELNGLKGQIDIRGKVNSRLEIKSIYESSDIFVLPTYFPQEAQPVSILEAMNFGLPVISTNHASIPEFIADGVNGILVEKRSSESIKIALMKLMNDPVFFETVSKGAKFTFDSKFSPDKYRENVLELIS